MPKPYANQIAVLTDRPAFPQECVCCGEEATDVYRPTPPGRLQGLPPPDRPLELPYCEACLKHVRKYQMGTTWILLGVIAATWGYVLAQSAGGYGAWLAIPPAFGGGLALFGFGARRSPGTKRNCHANDVSVRCIWHRRDEYRFSFASEAYAEKFRAANERLLAKGE